MYCTSMADVNAASSDMKTMLVTANLASRINKLQNLATLIYAQSMLALSKQKSEIEDGNARVILELQSYLLEGYRLEYSISGPACCLHQHVRQDLAGLHEFRHKLRDQRLLAQADEELRRMQGLNFNNLLAIR